MMDGEYGPVPENREWFYSLAARFNANGSIDSTFNNVGYHTVHASAPTTSNQNSGAKQTFAACHQQSDGKLYFVGFQRNGGVPNHTYLFRFNTNGSRDGSFGQNGAVILGDNADFVQNRRGSAVLVQPDGKIVVAGAHASGYWEDGALLMRFNATGTKDLQFADRGAFLETLPASQDTYFVRIAAMGLQFNSRILALSSGSTWRVTRFFSGLPLPQRTNVEPTPTETALFPNPAVDGVSYLRYTLDVESLVSIQLFDNLGRLLHTYVHNDLQNPSTRQVPIRLPADLPRGVYYLRLTLPSGATTIPIQK